MMLARLRMACRLFWCALAHQTTWYRGGLRCVKCNPVRKRRAIITAKDAVL